MVESVYLKIAFYYYSTFETRCFENAYSNDTLFRSPMLQHVTRYVSVRLPFCNDQPWLKRVSEACHLRRPIQ